MHYVGETRRRHRKLLWCEGAMRESARKRLRSIGTLTQPFFETRAQRDQDTRYLHVVVLYTFVRYA